MSKCVGSYNEAVHFFVQMCEFVIFSNACAQTFGVASVSPRVYVCVHGGEDSPGAWQYGAVALQTPPVKTPPMGPGQLWPTYTDLWAISLMILTHL